MRQTDDYQEAYRRWQVLKPMDIDARDRRRAKMPTPGDSIFGDSNVLLLFARFPRSWQIREGQESPWAELAGAA
jgi:hypothetical protein